FQPVAISTPRENEMEKIRADMQMLRQEILRLRQENETLYTQVTMRRILPEDSPRNDANELSAARRLLEQFCGNPDENFDDWLFNLERYFIRARTADDQKANFALDYLKGNARKVFLSLPN
ncbi:MAG: hypothetical protein ACK559_04505, partial [bacterium]